jgi:hypothetical protein
MIRHVVFFSAKNKRDIPAIMAGLNQLEQIPEARNFSVRENLKQDGIGNDIDIVVYAEFANTAALEAYKHNPIYQDTINIVRPLRELRFCADVEV